MIEDGYGNFTQDGTEFNIKVNKESFPQVPWSHILTNGRVGTIVTTNGGGNTWYINSRENKLTSWSNDVVSDRPSEIISIEDENDRWYAMPVNKEYDGEYEITFGFGYAKYSMQNKWCEQSLDIFVSNSLDEKVSILTLKNNSTKTKKVNLKYSVEAVLGVDLEYTKKHLVTRYEENRLKIYNRYNENYSNKEIYIKIVGEKLKKVTYAAEENYQVLETETQIEAGEKLEIAFVIGVVKKQYIEADIDFYKKEFENVKRYWLDKVTDICVETPEKSIDIMLNGWLKYQVLASRLCGRASFYQSGGAFGFRDQLQDVLGLIYTEPQLVKNQILYHSMQQFKEGDVLHWWHPEKNNGIRSRYTDDLLWLVYVTCEYIKVTNDYKILDIKTTYIDGRILKENENEAYINVMKSKDKESIYEHLKRAIEKSLRYGKNGLPQMGGGDWNDGMNEVHGESVWLGFFIYDILNKFIKICELKNDVDSANRYKKEMKFIKENLDKEAWDGNWYRRAFFEDGRMLGSNQCDECKIDSIAQSWAVISKAGEKEKQNIAMESLEKNLVDYENKVIKLLTPAFNKTKIEPGYIKAYIPGVRENGGQYTHAAIWAVIAETILQKKEKALELYKFVLPIEHYKTKELAEKYKVEPYVVAADVYSVENLAGMGGWTWYTGSASWCYKAGIENILGLVIENNTIKIKPCIPKEWKEYKIIYKVKGTIYKLNIKNKNENTSKTIPIEENKGIQEFEIII